MAQIIIGYRLTENSDYKALEAALTRLKFQRVGTTSLWMCDDGDGENTDLDNIHTKLKKIVNTDKGEELRIFKVEILDSRELSQKDTMATKVAMKWLLLLSRDQLEDV